MRKFSLDEMVEINGGMTAEEWLCSIGTTAGSSIVGVGLGLASIGVGFAVGLGLGILGNWMCATYAD